MVVLLQVLLGNILRHLACNVAKTLLAFWKADQLNKFAAADQ
jgi:hypothetical protein